MGFNDWINITPASMVADSKRVEIDKATRADLAEQIQTRVRSNIDPGVDLRGTKKVHAVRAKEDAGRIVISDEGGKNEAAKEDGEGGIEDLFNMGSGVPEFIGGRMVFRTIKDDKLWTRKSQDEQDQSVRHTVEDTLRMGIVDANTKAVKDVENRYPQEKYSDK